MEPIKVFVLLMYLSTPSAGTGMTTMVSEYGSLEKCEAAGKLAQKKFGGWATNVYYACAQK